MTYDMPTLKLFLDDIRTCPSDWLLVRALDDAKLHLESNQVAEASLDHDLGACEVCMGGRSVEEWMVLSDYQSMPHCEHVGTGYDLCLWMAETGFWPAQPPTVHSANPVGRERMEGVIARYWNPDRKPA